MPTVKKIAAAFFMIVSVLAIIIFIISTIGSWVVRARLETISIELLLAAEDLTVVSRDGLIRVDGLLDNTTTVITDVDATMRNVGSAVNERSQAVTSALSVVLVDLVPLLEQAIDTFNAVEANIIAINEAADAVAAIPLLGLAPDLPERTRLQEIEDTMAQVRSDAESLIAELRAMQEAIVDAQFSRATDVTGGALERIAGAQVRLDEAYARLETSAATMAAVRERIPQLYTLITIILNVLFILCILAFISLFMHAWQYFKCSESGLKATLMPECADAATP